MIAKIRVEDLRFATLPQEGGLLVQGEDVEGSLPRGSFFGRGKVARFLRSETFHCGCYCHDLFT